MYTVRSRMVRRGRTGRKATGTRVARRRVPVHHHHARRYAGVHPNRAAGARRRKGVRINKSGRHHRFFGRKKHLGPRAKPGHGLKRARNPLGRHGKRHFHGRKKSLHKRHFHGRKKALHKRHVKPGQHRHFKGRKYHGRHVKPGLHRHFHGRKTTHHKGRMRPKKPKAAPISSASYLSMF